jgi:hypothetical protein
MGGCSVIAEGRFRFRVNLQIPFATGASTSHAVQRILEWSHDAQGGAAMPSRRRPARRATQQSLARPDCTGASRSPNVYFNEKQRNIAFVKKLDLLSNNTRRKTMRNAIICSAALVAISAAAVIPAPAQTTTEYYIVQDVKTKKCTIVDKRPTTTSEVTVLGNTFKTHTEAESGMRTEKVCTTK